MSPLPLTELSRHCRLHAVGAVLVASAVFCVACNRAGALWWVPGWNINQMLAIDSPDRMVVARQSREGMERLQDIRDRMTIEEALNFFKRYPDGWVAFSGAPSDYDFYFYRNDQVLIRLGIRDNSRSSPGEAALNVDNYRRQVPAADVAALAARLNLIWPLPH